MVKENKTWWGRPKGVKQSEETKKKIGKKIKDLYLKKKKNYLIEKNNVKE